jgi:hypothetical protein
MPLFFLRVRDGVQLISNPDGSFIPDVVSEKTATIYSAGELMRHSIIGAPTPLPERRPRGGRNRTPPRIRSLLLNLNERQSPQFGSNCEPLKNVLAE